MVETTLLTYGALAGSVFFGQNLSEHTPQRARSNMPNLNRSGCGDVLTCNSQVYHSLATYNHEVTCFAVACWNQKGEMLPNDGVREK